MLNYLGYIEGSGSLLFLDILLKVLKIPQISPFILSVVETDSKHKSTIEKMLQEHQELKKYRFRESGTKDEIWGKGYTNWMKIKLDLPAFIKLKSRNVKQNREQGFLRFFSGDGARITLDMKLLDFKVINKGQETPLFSTSLDERYRDCFKLFKFNHIPRNLIQTKARRKSSYYDDNLMESEISLGKRHHQVDK